MMMLLEREMVSDYKFRDFLNKWQRNLSSYSESEFEMKNKMNVQLTQNKLTETTVDMSSQKKPFEKKMHQNGLDQCSINGGGYLQCTMRKKSRNHTIGWYT